MNAAQQAEIAKYAEVYRRPDYRMGATRYMNAAIDLRQLPVRGGLLDVGCGRGEILRLAEELGFRPVRGAEVVPELIDGHRVVHGLAWELPFGDAEFDVVTMFDVIEHLLHEDQAAALKELERVAHHAILITAASFSHVVDGVEMHPGRRSPAEWHALLAETLNGEITPLTGRRNITSTWVVRYGN